MKNAIDHGLILGVIVNKDGQYVVSHAATRDQINTYVQFLLEEIHWLGLQKVALEGEVLDTADLMS